MTESFTLSLFVYAHFLCTTCLYCEKDVGGGLCHGHISHLVCPKTLLLDRLEHAKKGLEKSRKQLLRSASDSQICFCRLAPASSFRS